MFGLATKSVTLTVSPSQFYASFADDMLSALQVAGYHSDGQKLADWKPTTEEHHTLHGLLGKLESLGSGDAIAKWFLDEGVRGFRNNSARCPVQQWLRVVTDTDYKVTGSSVLTIKGNKHEVVAVLPQPVREFINNFDRGAYPELALGIGCGCKACAAAGHQVVPFPGGALADVVA